MAFYECPKRGASSRPSGGKFHHHPRTGDGEFKPLFRFLEPPPAEKGVAQVSFGQQLSENRKREEHSDEGAFHLRPVIHGRNCRRAFKRHLLNRSDRTR